MREGIFLSYLKLGFEHIIDITAFDHLLFVVTLCAFFSLNEWRKILILVTAFTIGHSLTLALSSFNLVPSNPFIIECLIPITIMLTAITNVIKKQDTRIFKTLDKQVIVNYVIAMGFGLIHGMGFAGGFKMMLGTSSGIVKQLLAFNCGIELGQICIVGVYMMALFAYTKLIRGNHRSWNVFISGAGFGIALTLLIKVASA